MNTFWEILLSFVLLEAFFFLCGLIIGKIKWIVKRSKGHVKSPNTAKRVLYTVTCKHYFLAIIPLVIFGYAFFNLYTPALNYCRKQKKNCYQAIRYDMDTLAKNNKHISVFSYENLSVKKAEQIVYIKAPEKKDFFHLGKKTEINYNEISSDDDYSDDFGNVYQLRNRRFRELALQDYLASREARAARAVEQAYSEAKDRWYNEFGRFWGSGIQKVYYANTEKNEDSGWLIARNYSIYDTMKTSTCFLYPNKVGIFQDNPNEAINMSNVNKSCDEAYFQIMNEDSIPAKLTLTQYYDIAENMRNKYYHVKVDSTGKNPVHTYDENIAIKNEYGITYVTRLPMKTFSICENTNRQEYNEANKIDIIGKILCVNLLLLSLYGVCGFARSKRKTLNEAIYKDLLVKCNPAKFMKPYNKEKVEVANTLTQLLTKTSPNDEEQIVRIEETAHSKLGVNIIDKKYVRQLKRVIYPKKFLKPYDEKKFSLANELYTLLADGNVTYAIIKDVDKRATELQ